MSDSQTPENTNEDLTEAQLFSRISKSIQSNDFDQLDALVTTEAPAEEPLVANEPVVEVAEPAVAASAEVQEVEEVIPEPAVATPSDWTAGLPKEAQDELQRLRSTEQKYRSESGRVPFLQKRLAELEKKLQQENQPPRAAVSSGTAPNSNKELQDALAQIQEVDPVTAKAFELLRQEVAGSAHKTQSILEQRDEEALLAKEFEKLTKQVPQAPQVFQLPEWQEWKEAQTPGLYELANSSYADDVVVAIEKFAKDMQVRYPGIVENQTTSAPKVEEKVEPAPAVVDTKQAAVVEQRARRLAATTPASAAPAPKVSSEPTDPEALMRHFYAQIMKEDHLDKRR